MKKLITFFLFFSILSPIFAQEEIQDPYLQVYENIYIGLERQNFNYIDFSDSVNIFTFIDNKIYYNKGTNEVLISDLNTVLVYLGYDKFSITKCKSEKDRGFIIHLFKENKLSIVYMLIDESNKINTILIKK
jgi:hypothetical protein